MATAREMLNEIITAVDLLPDGDDVPDESLVLPRGLNGLADNLPLLKGVMTYAVNTNTRNRELLYLMVMNSATGVINTQEDISNYQGELFWAFTMASHLGLLVKDQNSLLMPLVALFGLSDRFQKPIPQICFAIFKNPDAGWRDLSGIDPFDAL